MAKDDNKNSRAVESTMKSELKKVIWPTGKQTAKSTAITIGFVLLVSIILIVLNLFFDFISDKYYDLVLGTGDSHNHGQQVITSGDVSGDISNNLESGELGSGEIVSGETVSGEISGDSANAEG